MYAEIKEYCEAREIEMTNIVVRNDETRLYPMIGYVRCGISTKFADLPCNVADSTLPGAFKNKKVMVGYEPKDPEEEFEVLPQYYVTENSFSLLNNEPNGFATLVEFKYEANKALTDLLAQYCNAFLNEIKELQNLNRGADKKDDYLLAYIDTWMIIYESCDNTVRISSVDQSIYDWSMWFSPSEFKNLCKSVNAAVLYDMTMVNPRVSRIRM